MKKIGAFWNKLEYTTRVWIVCFGTYLGLYMLLDLIEFVTGVPI